MTVRFEEGFVEVVVDSVTVESGVGVVEDSVVGDVLSAEVLTSGVGVDVEVVLEVFALHAIASIKIVY
jgi:hypothetical protein